MTAKPEQIQQDQHDILTSKSVAVNISSTDFDLTAQFTEGYARRLYVGVGGDVVATKLNDAGSLTYKNVPTGAYLDGLWITVVKVGTTATNIIAER